MLFTTVTNLARNTVSIAILFALLFCQKDESLSEDKYSAPNQTYFWERYQERTIRNRIHMGFSKHSRIRLEQSTDDNRQL